MKKIGIIIATMSIILLAGSCKKDGDVMQPVNPGNAISESDLAAKSSAGEITMNAYYNGSLVKVAVFQFSEDVARKVVLSHKVINRMFTMRSRDFGELRFDPVIESVKSSGFNPVWQQVTIEFTPMHKPRQFNSLDQIEVALKKGEIILIATNRIFHGRLIITPEPGPDFERS